MNIDQVFKEAGDKSIALVRDGAIFYLVLNRPENVFDFDTIAAINACLDEVEKSTGAACLVTIGSGDKVFSTGFNLKFWATGVIPQFQSIVLIQEMFDRMLTIGVPTLCVMNGMTIAGGLLFALMHDFRIMKDDPKCFTCLSEINVGLSLTPAFGAMVKYQLDPQASRLMMFGGRFGPQDSLKLRVADSLYKTKDDLLVYIQKWAKEMAPKAVNRVALKDMKQNIHHDTHMKLVHGGLTWLELKNAKVFDLSILKPPGPKL